MSLRVRQWIWSRKWTFFPCLYLVGMAIGYAIGPYFWQLVR
jgi:hypothetical protein